MAIKIIDVLQANLVLVGVGLINTQDEVAAFRRDVGTEVLSTEAGLGGELVNRSHNLNRDRIGITRVSDRTTIVREYPQKDGLDRLATVARSAIDVTEEPGDELRAFGYNIEIVYEPDPTQFASQYLADRLFVPNVLQDQRATLLGGAARIYFQKNGLGWQLNLEPRLNEEQTNSIFASLNLHYPGPRLTLPTKEEILLSLTSVWYEAHDLIDRLDKGTAS